MLSRDLTYHVGTSGRFFPHVEHVLTVGDVFWSSDPGEVPHEVGEVVMALWAKKEKKHRMNSHPIIHCPTSEGVSEVSEPANE